MSDPAGTVSWCWLDGTVRPTAETTISVTDHGLTVGDGIFETMKVVDGTPFALSRHLARLHRSADALGLVLPLDDEALATAAPLRWPAPGTTATRWAASASPSPAARGRPAATGARRAPPCWPSPRPPARGRP